MSTQINKHRTFPKLFKLSVGIAAGVLWGACVAAAFAQTQQSIKSRPAVRETLPAKKAPAIQKNVGEPVYQVMSPLGDTTVKMITMVPRLNTLAGKTVCTIWTGAFKSDVTLPVIAELLKKNYPDIKIVPYTEFPKSQTPEAPGTPLTASLALQAALKEKGCNAVISGNGG